MHILESKRVSQRFKICSLRDVSNHQYVVRDHTSLSMVEGGKARYCPKSMHNYRRKQPLEVRVSLSKIHHIHSHSSICYGLSTTKLLHDPTRLASPHSSSLSTVSSDKALYPSHSSPHSLNPYSSTAIVLPYTQSQRDSHLPSARRRMKCSGYFSFNSSSWPYAMYSANSRASLSSLVSGAGGGWLLGCCLRGGRLALY